MRPKCSCSPSSPFLWRQDTRPSIFMADTLFRANAASGSVAATQRVEQARARGERVGTMYGISRNREAEILRMRVFNTFALAMPSKGTK